MKLNLWGFKPLNHELEHEKSLRFTSEGLDVDFLGKLNIVFWPWKIWVFRSQEDDFDYQNFYGNELWVYKSILPIMSTLALDLKIA